MYYLQPESIVQFLAELSCFLKATNSVLIFDVQTAASKLLLNGTSAEKQIGLSEKIESLDHWVDLIENISNLTIYKFYKLGMADKWGRLKDHREKVTSCFFLVGGGL